MTRGWRNFKEHQQGPLEDSLWSYTVADCMCVCVCIFEPHMRGSIDCVKFNMTGLIRRSEHVPCRFLPHSFIFFRLKEEERRKEDEQLNWGQRGSDGETEREITCLQYCTVEGSSVQWFKQISITLEGKCSSVSTSLWEQSAASL